MEKTLQVFNYKAQEVRTTIINDEVWFVAKDVCDVLEISKYRDAISRLDKDERVSVKVDTLGGTQRMTAINESGLYTLIFRSNKPEAKQFSRWVRHEVLPTIRKTGSYSLRLNMNISQSDLECASFIYQSAGIKGNQLTIALNNMYRTYSGKNALEAGEITLEAPTKQQPYPRWKSNITLDEITEDE